jgi:hypothetical protein
MKWRLAIPAALTLALGAGLAYGQDGHMMSGGWYGGWMGGYGGVWIPILLVVIVGLLAWIVMKKRK